MGEQIIPNVKTICAHGAPVVFVKFVTKLATPDDQTIPKNTQLNTKGVKTCPCKHWPIC